MMMNLRALIIGLLLTLTFCTSQANGFDKVIIWGHKLHSHTHSYIHCAFYKAFTYLGYETYWMDEKDNVEGFDFSNSLFLTEGQADKKIPLRNDCTYILHNPQAKKYEKLKNKIYLQVYNDTLLSIPSIVKIDSGIYFDLPAKCIYMPWATDLLPYEIDDIKSKLSTIQKVPAAYWIGTIGEGRFGNKPEIDLFKKACDENGIKFVAVNTGGTGISLEEHIDYISKSYVAPAIVGKWQNENGYIPCRIFKNISYGQLGVTNSKRVHDLFEGQIVYNPNTYQLFYDAQKKLETHTLEDQYKLMDIVKNKHTYLNRIESLLRFIRILNLYEQSYQ